VGFEVGIVTRKVSFQAVRLQPAYVKVHCTVDLLSPNS